MKIAALAARVALSTSFAQNPVDSEAVYTLPGMSLKSKYRNQADSSVVENKIVSGKKLTIISSENLVTIPNQNLRQTLSEVPGLMATEVNNESFSSLTYRGLGDPHESFNVLILRDGVPAAADPYGYPAAYYSPHQDSIDKVYFYRGGSGLLFGPQPGGVLNFELKSAPEFQQALQIQTKNLVGSFDRYSTHTSFSHGSDKLGTLGSFHMRGGSGHREANSDSQVTNPRINVAFLVSETSVWNFDLDYFQGKFGEPGGLARTAGANVFALGDGPDKTTLRNDRLEIERFGIGAEWKKEWNTDLNSNLHFWHTTLSRNSFRQTLGASPTFGGIAQGSENRIQAQDFSALGTDLRINQKYSLFNQTHDLTLALTAMSSFSPYSLKNGASATATDGVIQKDLDRTTISQALVLENAFRYEKLTVTPGIRFESIKQKIDEKLNVGSAVPLRNNTETVDIQLLGLGIEYQIAADFQTYANLSEGYKPPAFQDSIPLGTGDLISEDLEESRTWSKELGVRGKLSEIEFDLSAFEIDYTNQFGRVGNVFQNIGSTRSEGLELSVSTNLDNKWDIYGSGSLLEAEIVNGTLMGNRVQYSPAQVYKAGVGYNYGAKSKIRLQGQWISSHYADDGNTNNFRIPGYDVYDLTVEHSLGKQWRLNDLSLQGGIQNLTGKDYYSRIRSNGIEPGAPRQFFAGLNLVF